MLNTYLKDYKENGGDILSGLNIVKILQVKDGWRRRIFGPEKNI